MASNMPRAFGLTVLLFHGTGSNVTYMEEPALTTPSNDGSPHYLYHDLPNIYFAARFTLCHYWLITCLLV